MKKKIYWAGFVEGKLYHVWFTNEDPYCEAAVYKTKKQAKKFFQDVRAVRITEVRKK